MPHRSAGSTFSTFNTETTNQDSAHVLGQYDKFSHQSAVSEYTYIWIRLRTSPRTLRIVKSAPFLYAEAGSPTLMSACGPPTKFQATPRR